MCYLAASMLHPLVLLSLRFKNSCRIVGLIQAALASMRATKNCHDGSERIYRPLNELECASAVRVMYFWNKIP